MWQEEQAHILRREIEALLAPLVDTSTLYDLVKEPLTKTRRCLAKDAPTDFPWPLLTLLVCEATCGRFEQAVPAAAGLQLLMAAGDVFDDLEDADSEESISATHGPAIATNVATTLLVLAEKAIARLRTAGVADKLTIRVFDTVNSYYTTACVGQHLDLSLNSRVALSEDAYLEVAGMKSATQIECACYVGALLGNASQELVNEIAVFGKNLGMAAQITNDIQGVTKGNDIIKRKISLPIICCFNQVSGTERAELEAFFSSNPQTQLDSNKVKGLVYNSGAIHYSIVRLESYKQQALQSLTKAERAGAKVNRLQLFLV